MGDHCLGTKKQQLSHQGGHQLGWDFTAPVQETPLLAGAAFSVEALLGTVSIRKGSLGKLLNYVALKPFFPLHQAPKISQYNPLGSFCWAGPWDSLTVHQPGNQSAAWHPL